MAGDGGRAGTVDEGSGAARGIEFGKRPQYFDLEAECGEHRGRVGHQRVRRPSGQLPRQPPVEARQLARRLRHSELPQAPDRVEPHRRYRVAEHPAHRFVRARRTDRPERDHDPHTKRLVRFALQKLEQHVQGRRITQPGKRFQGGRPFRGLLGVAQAREQRGRRFAHPGTPQGRDRPQAQGRMGGREQAAQQLHRLRPGEAAERIDGTAPHQGVRVGAERLDDEVEALPAPDPAERGDAVSADLFPRLVAQAPLQRGKRPGIGEESERGVRGRADSMARLPAGQELQHRRRPSRLAPVAQGLRGSRPHVGGLASKRGDERIEGDGPVLPSVRIGGVGRAEQRSREQEPAGVSEVRARPHPRDVIRFPVRSPVRAGFSSHVRATGPSIRPIRTLRQRDGVGARTRCRDSG